MTDEAINTEASLVKEGKMTDEAINTEAFDPADPISVPQEPERNQVALEVIAGKWGRGQDRRRRLAEAGHDPDSVQAAVDEIISQ